MGNYNPHIPYILGQEWVPIRDEALAYSPVINTVERGTEFVLSNATVIGNARFYVNKLPSDSVTYQVAQFNLYPAGLEDQTGPIQQVLIPAKSVTVTGSNITLVGASYDAALYQPSDNSYVLFNYNSGTSQRVGMFFDVSAYPVLANKRILNVSLAYAGAVDDLVQAGGGSRHVDFVHPFDGSSLTGLDQTDDVGNAQSFLGLSSPSNTGTLAELNTIVGRTGTAHDDLQVAYVDLGDINNGWSTGAAIGTTGGEKLPWRYVDLLRFEPSATNRQYLKLSVTIPLTENGSPAGSGNDVQMYLDYCALRVIYCEEKRVAYGGQQFGYGYGSNQITVRNTTFTTDPSIPAGTYLPTLSFVSAGQVGFGGNLTSDFPDINATRQLYEIPSHPAVEVDIPFPLAERLGETFTSKASAILPQLSLQGANNTLSVPLIDPHVYGRQVAAQVYGTNTATQDIYDSAVAAASYPQVRYYARRFGDTTIPLTLSAAFSSALFEPGVASNNATTPDNAALDIIGDIDLRADVALANWASTGAQRLIGKWSTAAGNQSYILQVNNTVAQLVWTPDGSTATAPVSTVAIPVSNGQRLTIRATLDVNNGAGGSTTTFYTGPGVDGPWTQLGATVINAVTSIFSGNAQVEVGSEAAAPAGASAGYFYAVKILNGIGGTEVANPNFAAQAPGTGSFADSAGRTWTINTTAAIVGGFPSLTAAASITVSEFDALPEILDGWREVTLRFTSPQTMGGSAIPPAWTWSATSETAGNRWEVLGASAPAIASTAGSLYTKVPFPGQLGDSTYQPSEGGNICLSWMPQGVASGWVTGAARDPATDAVLIFSQDPATITGVSLTQLTQTVSGIGTLCGSLPCCIPSGIGYNQISWSGVNFLSVAALSLSGVSGSYASTPDNAALDIIGDIDIRADIQPTDWTPSVNEAIVGKWVTAGNQLSYLLLLHASGVLQIFWTTTGAIGSAVSASSTVAPTPGADGRLAIRAAVDVNNGAAGNTTRFYTGPGVNGPWTQLGSSVTNAGASSIFSGTAPLEVGSVDNGTTNFFSGKIYAVDLRDGLNGTAVANPNFAIQPVGTTTFTDAAGRVWTINGSASIVASGINNTLFGAYELQRYDSIVGDFQTIMLSTTVSGTSFKDYEARSGGVVSVYRIRALNALNFAGAWSAYVSGTGTAPGITIAGGCDNTGALIFTSNGDQTGANNAAYVMQWDNIPAETFDLFEADDVVYQPMYGRAGRVAFHGTERGLEEFSRVVLLQAGAIALPSLANAADIRDLAWDDLPYVCVRDGRGNRWFSNVRIPNINVRNDAQSYLAKLNVVETTRTPYPVDP